jgi:hypothetical protein
MDIQIIRHFKGNLYTIGHLLLNNVMFCDTLEPPVRLPGVKLLNHTAITCGTYKVQFRHSPTFGCLMPYILDVPDFTDVMFHVGNTVNDTHGCILVGNNAIKGALINSKLKFDVLKFELLKYSFSTLTIC